MSADQNSGSRDNFTLKLRACLSQIYGNMPEIEVHKLFSLLEEYIMKTHTISQKIHEIYNQINPYHTKDLINGKTMKNKKIDIH